MALALFNWISYAVSTALNFLRGGFQKTLDWIATLWNLFFEGLYAAFEGFVQWMVSLLPPEMVGFFDFSSNPAWQWIGDVSQIVPVGAWLALAGSVYGVCGGIRLVRWIIGFVPTVEG